MVSKEPTGYDSTFRCLLIVSSQGSSFPLLVTTNSMLYSLTYTVRLSSSPSHIALLIVGLENSSAARHVQMFILQLVAVFMGHCIGLCLLWLCFYLVRDTTFGAHVVGNFRRSVCLIG